MEFTYYDVSTNSYKTIKTQSFKLDVAKGDGSAGLSADYSDLKNQDIHPIKEGDVEIQDLTDIFYGSTSYWVILSVLFAMFAGVLILFRKACYKQCKYYRFKEEKSKPYRDKTLKVCKPVDGCK